MSDSREWRDRPDLAALAGLPDFHIESSSDYFRYEIAYRVSKSGRSAEGAMEVARGLTIPALMGRERALILLLAKKLQ